MRFISLVIGTATVTIGAKLLISWPVQTGIAAACAIGAILALLALASLCQWIDDIIDDIQWRYYWWKRERELNREEIIYIPQTLDFEMEGKDNENH
jgi:hypothetical protein